MNDYHKHLEGPRWQHKRLQIVKRDNGRCVNCRSQEDLQVHHIKYIGHHPCDTPNCYLVTLCEPCHLGYHNGTNHLTNVETISESEKHKTGIFQERRDCGTKAGNSPSFHRVMVHGRPSGFSKMEAKKDMG